MSYRVLLTVKLDSPATILRLLLLHEQLRVGVDWANGVSARSNQEHLRRHMANANRLVITSSRARGYAELNRSDGSNYSMSFDGDYNVDESQVASVAELSPHRFFAEPGGNRNTRDRVSRFYQQAHVIDKLEQEGLQWEADSSYRDSQGVWCPGNVRASQANSESQMVGNSSW